MNNHSHVLFVEKLLHPQKLALIWRAASALLNYHHMQLVRNQREG